MSRETPPPRAPVSMRHTFTWKCGCTRELVALTGEGAGRVRKKAVISMCESCRGCYLCRQGSRQHWQSTSCHH
eukprot:scaffold236013_cov21-Tisochrysis_lutea.AAC.1